MPRISVVIPTYRRGQVLVETLDHLFGQLEAGDELIVVDQTERHDPATRGRLQELQARRAIRWIRQEPPSITAAMNRGLIAARADVVLFVDDDIVPDPSLLRVHREAQATGSRTVVAGQVIQPWDVGGRASSVFATAEAGWVDEFMGGNFSVQRAHALELGGFDENFVQVAYRYEAEFAARFRAAGGRIRFEPLARLHHLRAARGGTRSYGDHLTTLKPAHAVGAYYFVFRTQSPRRWVRQCFTRSFRAITTRHHLRGPWWIPVTLSAELRGMWWAMRLHHEGPKLIAPTERSS